MCAAGVLIGLPLLPWRLVRIRLGSRFGRPMGRAVLWIAGVRLVGDWAHLATREPALYVTNHASNADPWMAMVVCPTGGCGVAKREIARIPFFGWAYVLSGHLLLDRSSSASAIQSMKELAALVREHGLSVWLWPEGTQSNDGGLLPFKRGFVHLAIAAGLPVVPVLFHDAHVRWPARSMRLVPGDVRVEILDAVDTSSWRAETAAEHAEAVRSVMAGHLAAA